MNILELLGNIIFGILIVVLMITQFKKKLQITTTDLILTAFFIVIPLIANVALTMSFFLGGVIVMKIGVHQQLMAIGGAKISLPLSLIAGIVVDVLGLIFSNVAARPYLGFTFNYLLCYSLGSLILNSKFNFSKSQLNILLFVPAILTSIFIFLVEKIHFEKLVIKMNEVKFLISNRLLIILFIWLLTVIFVGIVSFSHQFLRKYNQSMVNKWILVVIIIELVVNILLTSLHLNVMYGIPILGAMIPRLVKAVLLIPIYTLFGSVLLHVLRNIRGLKQNV